VEGEWLPCGELGPECRAGVVLVGGFGGFQGAGPDG
jgi:hypothetical protein